MEAAPPDPRRCRSSGRATLRAVVLAVLLAAGFATAEERPRKTLAECLAIALRSHPELGVAGSDLEAGRQRARQALSGALPQLSASYSADRRNTTASQRTGAPVGGDARTANRSRTFNFFSTGATLSQLLFDFGRSLNEIRAARASERALAADADATRETIVLEVKQSYWNLLEAIRLAGVADENVRQNRKHLDFAEGRFDVGLAPKFDVTQARVQLASSELSQLQARNNVAVARENLRTAMGLDEPLDFDVVDTLGVQDVSIGEAEAVAAAYEHRAELRSRMEQANALEQRIAALRKDYLPALTGDASYVWSGQQYPLQESWNFGASANWSIFNGGLTTAQIGENRANLQRLRFEEQRLRQQIGLEVRQATLNLTQAAAAIRVSEKALGQARENVEIAEGRYQAGVGNIIEVTDAQASLVSSEASYVQSLADYRTSVAALERATGRSFSQESVTP